MPFCCCGTSTDIDLSTLRPSGQESKEEIIAMLKADITKIKLEIAESRREVEKYAPLQSSAEDSKLLTSAADLGLYGLGRKSDVVFFKALENGASTTVQDEMGRTPLHWVAAGGWHRGVMQLLAHKAAVDADDKKGRTAIVYGIHKNGAYRVCEALAAGGANLEKRDITAHTPLHHAALHGRYHCVLILIALGGHEGIKPANVNPQDMHQQTPLHLASAAGNDRCVSLLLEYNAKVTSDEDGRQPLHCSARGGFVQTMAALLPVSDVNHQDNLGRSPLFDAALTGQDRALEFLLKHSADYNLRDKSNFTALHIAAGAGSKKWVNGRGNCARLLLLAGADANAKDSEGRTPLHWASKHGQVDMTNILIEGGADPAITDNTSATPALVLVSKGEIKIGPADPIGTSEDGRGIEATHDHIAEIDPDKKDSALVSRKSSLNLSSERHASSPEHGPIGSPRTVSKSPSVVAVGGLASSDHFIDIGDYDEEDGGETGALISQMSLNLPKVAPTGGSQYRDPGEALQALPSPSVRRVLELNHSPFNENE